MEVLVLGRAGYASTVDAMRSFTERRIAATPDEIWLCEHDPVYTIGIAGRPEHLRDSGGIPVVRADRGGQVTYHAPGQVVAYPLVDLRRLGIYAKEYVFRLEAALLKVLESYGATGYRVRGAPGVYVCLADPRGHAVLWRDAREPAAFDGLAKIAAVGVRITRHCAWHGVALNVAMDLAPFSRIDPCGYAGLEVIDLSRLGIDTDCNEAGMRLAARLAAQFDP